MRTSRVRLRILLALIIAMDAAALLWIVAARSHGTGGVGGGPPDAYHTVYTMYDDSAVSIIYDHTTGKTIEHKIIHPASTAGLFRVFWPLFVAVPGTLVGLLLIRTDHGRRFVAEFPLPRMTLWRLMIAVGVVGVDAGLILRALGSSGLWFTRWTPMRVDLVILNALGLIAIGVALLFRLLRRRRAPDCSEIITFYF